jgi:hypothetical protein
LASAGARAAGSPSIPSLFSLFSESTLTDPEQRDHPSAVIIECQVCRDIGAKGCAIQIKMPLLKPSSCH